MMYTPFQPQPRKYGRFLEVVAKEMGEERVYARDECRGGVLNLMFDEFGTPLSVLARLAVLRVYASHSRLFPLVLAVVVSFTVSYRWLPVLICRYLSR